MKKLLLGLLFLSMPAMAARGPSDPPPASFTTFFSTTIWNMPIQYAQVHPNNSLWIDIINGHAGHNLHADFGSTFAGAWNGIPYNIVFATNTSVPVTVGSYAAESDTVPAAGLKLPADAICEGDPANGISPVADLGGDRHCILVDVSSHTLYEMANSTRDIVGGSTVSWHVSQLSIWDTNSNLLRPDEFTSADAGGLPIYPLLIRPDEIQSGAINHALRFTIVLTHGPHLWPARHDANSGGINNPPFGMRVRMKSTYVPQPVLCASTTNQIIITAMKTYGMIMADNGGDWFVSGAPSSSWDSNDLAGCFNSIFPINAFEVIEESTWMVDPDQAAGQSPVITPSSMTGSVQIQ